MSWLCYRGGIFNEGFYKNGQPFNGMFAQRVATDYHYITRYENGKRQGKEVLLSIYNPVMEYGYTHYINDKKEGEYLLSATDFLPEGVTEAKVIFKNDKPYSGTFITNESPLIMSTFRTGLKDGWSLKR